MPVLGIESSAHTLGVGIVDNGTFLANEKMMFKIKSGIIPMKVADFHARNARNVLYKALSKAGLKIKDIDAVGYTKGPGLGPCLRVGQLMARSIASAYGMPIYPVNHAVAHIDVTKHLSGFNDPLSLYVSGGNSQILAIEELPFRHYHVYGETFDIGVGNMLDSFARSAKLVPAWGSTVARVAANGNYIEMPYTVKGMDFSFTGLLTSAVKLIGKKPIEDIAFSLQETAFSMIVEATERALLLNRKRELTVSGGVAQSLVLQGKLATMARTHGARFYVAPNEYNADNGAMIALVAEKMYKSRLRQSLDQCSIDQKYRIDKVRITW
ncbi:MAG: KEOPS complex N(6)-L-threonylcarbamoyladenine synthase Kae1 [Candidatus Micrarchaeia archaeon]